MNSQEATRTKAIYKQSKLKSPYKKLPLVKRYWIYQWERLPLIPLVLMALSVCAAVMLAAQLFNWQRLIVAAVLISTYLLQIRFADEPKDFEHDNQYYPTRPVQRGVITLSELFMLRNIAIGLFFVAAASLFSLQIFLLAILQQFYSYLTRKEFFIRKWLRKHFLIYMFSHYFQLLILSWLVVSVLNVPFSDKPLYFGFAILLMAIVELARKIQEQDNDKAGDTYSSVLGRPKAIGSLLLLTSALAAYCGWLLLMLDSVLLPYFVVAIGVTGMFFMGYRYYRNPNKTNTKTLQASSLGYYFICTVSIMIGALI